MTEKSVIEGLVTRAGTKALQGLAGEAFGGAEFGTHDKLIGLASLVETTTSLAQCGVVQQGAGTPLGTARIGARSGRLLQKRDHDVAPPDGCGLIETTGTLKQFAEVIAGLDPNVGGSVETVA